MRVVSEINQVLGFIEKVKHGAVNYNSNFYLDIQKVELWISLQILEIEEFGDTIFFIRRNKEFFNLYFVTGNPDSLKSNLNILQIKYSNSIFVIDLVGIENNINEFNDLFLQNGYYLYTSLMRMSKTSNDLSIRIIEGEKITYAQRADAATIFSYFTEYFDPYCEQIPLVEEISKWINNGQLIIYSEDKKNIQGFLIYEKIGQTAYLRYWFVHPGHRDKKIGSALIHFFFKECSSVKRQIFWVIRSNTNAIKRYEHYGFKAESLIDVVFINRNTRYERENN
jgi:ribosomal protein S18 acetylase RimI-like enzyme